jgi:hypothetical protein
MKLWKVGALWLLMACVSASIAGAATITVTAELLWTDSGIYLTPDMTVNLRNATGQWTWGGSWLGGPEGDPIGGAANIWDEWITDGLHGQLIGYVGANPFSLRTSGQNSPDLFQVGTNSVTLTGRTGELWLGFNDDFSSDATSDNRGCVTVEAAVPEPSTILLWAGLGTLGLVALRRRRKQAA